MVNVILMTYLGDITHVCDRAMVCLYHQVFLCQSAWWFSGVIDHGEDRYRVTCLPPHHETDEGWTHGLRRHRRHKAPNVARSWVSNKTLGVVYGGDLACIYSCSVMNQPPMDRRL